MFHGYGNSGEYNVITEQLPSSKLRQEFIYEVTNFGWIDLAISQSITQTTNFRGSLKHAPERYRRKYYTDAISEFIRRESCQMRVHTRSFL
jgi:hypothetical protein